MTIGTDEMAERYRRHGTEEWQRYGSDSEHHRYSVSTGPRERRRCSCCKRRATHRGMANGVALMSGCEWRVAQWVREAGKGDVEFLQRQIDRARRVLARHGIFAI